MPLTAKVQIQAEGGAESPALEDETPRGMNRQASAADWDSYSQAQPKPAAAAASRKRSLSSKGLSAINIAPNYWTLFSVLAFLAFWEFASNNQLISPIFFPPPSLVARTLAELAQDGEIWNHFGMTMSRLWGGLLLGGIPAVCLGLAMGWSPWLRSVLDPLIALGHPIPKVAILPLIMVIFGIGDFSRSIVVGLAVFFPLLINTIAGVAQIGKDYFELAAIYNARPHKVFTRVILPGSLPMIIAGFRIAINVALVVTIAVEMVASQTGLGNMVWMSWEIMRIDELYAAIFLISVLGLFFNYLANLMNAKLTPWRINQD